MHHKEISSGSTFSLYQGLDFTLFTVYFQIRVICYRLPRSSCIQIFAIALHTFFFKNLLVSFFSEVILSLFAFHFVFYLSSFNKRCCTNLAHLYINALFKKYANSFICCQNESNAHRSSDQTQKKLFRRHLNVTVLPINSANVFDRFCRMYFICRRELRVKNIIEFPAYG